MSLHFLLQEYWFASCSVDQKHLLWSKVADDAIGIETVIERVYKLKYKDFASLKVLVSSTWQKGDDWIQQM